MKSYSEAQLSGLLRKLSIPPCPSILMEIAAELRKENSNQQRVAALIRSDVALSAAVLKVINAAGSGVSRKVTSINEAIILLGNQNLVNYVVGDFLKRTLNVSENQKMERFWDRAAVTAEVCATLSARFGGSNRETAYCFGLFHDCGMLMMMQRYPDYKETLRLANQSEAAFTGIEEQKHGADHATIGYLLTRSWGLSDVLSEAIQSHHEYQVLEEGVDHGVSHEACVLIALNLVSEFIVGKHMHSDEDGEWRRGSAQVAAFFGHSLAELDDVVEDVLFELQSRDTQSSSSVRGLSKGSGEKLA